MKELAAFCEIDFGATMARLGSGIVYIKNTQSVPSGAQASASPQGKDVFEAVKPLKHLAKRVINKAGLSDVALVKKVQNNLALTEAKTYKQVTFKPGDVIFISWGEWWDENFLHTLEENAEKNELQIVPVIHDVLPFTLAPQFSGHSTESLMNYCRRVVPVSSLVLCVSQSTRDDLANWLEKQSIPLPKMEVFRLGEDFEFAKAEKPDDPVFQKSGLKGNDYLLTVGTIEARKNHALLYNVYKLAKARGIELPKLVIVGRRGWKTEQIYDFMTQDPEVKDKFVFLHNASDENLSWLYDHALFSVFPSFCEGWGMPIAESVARGVPCVCSNTTSMIEVAEGYVTHFTPSSTDECLEAIVAMQKPENLEKWRKKCASYKQTTWDQSFAQVKELMEEVVYDKN
ncbi:glycosyltransferase family 1 protein [Streptomyces caniscabiei]|uniref:glycosyltransferase family 4 protein n=1 Tax=Streptomyces caniscabiei TaxID=2746961 RepID=UPI0029BF641D|nr:glycosyltransferase family 1 protein [Streptomyces caniscabiei]MDX2776412.1 glycosyltransferase family 1 protein [Streptomyces caniscabiei]